MAQSNVGREVHLSAIQSPERVSDLFVIGGGINGAAIARDAAGRGWRALLVEKDDLAAHTSSALRLAGASCVRVS